MPSVTEHLLIVGASTRAAGFSALRAGLRPWCADLFADRDLQARCPVFSLAGDYPLGILGLVGDGPPGPVMYTGGLENRPKLVHRLAQLRPLWGNHAAVLRQVRSPYRVTAVLRQHGFSCAEVIAPASAPHEGRWLLKPIGSSGGAGIRFWNGESLRGRRHGEYLQQYLEGESWAAVFVGDGTSAQLLGVTQQLVGASWLHARPFHYCGSIGPMILDSTQREVFLRLGDVLASSFHLRGLFGVDCVLQNGAPYPVEVNPRYTASVEVLEYATGLAALCHHAEAFQRNKLSAPKSTKPIRDSVAKAVYFAPQGISFPDRGPWLSVVEQAALVEQLPEYADIPHPGQPIAAGRPVLTFFAHASSPTACLDRLKQTAAELDRWFA
jgi:uncharacterized protein